MAWASRRDVRAPGLYNTQYSGKISRALFLHVELYLAINFSNIVWRSWWYLVQICSTHSILGWLWDQIGGYLVGGVQIAEINWESYGLRVPTGAETITSRDSRRHFRLTLLLPLFEIYLECWQSALNKGKWLCPSVSLFEIFMQDSKESRRTENVTSSYSTCCQRPFA